MENVIDLLRARGFIEAVTSEEIRSLTEKPIKVYCGFDPTSDSLHLGNLVGIIGLAWFQRCGHTPVAIVGGATGMIGDPSGKTEERKLLTPAAIDFNLIGIRKNLEAVLQQGSIPPLILNNLDWFQEFTLIDFLRDVGKFFRLGPMLGKESVRKRLEASEEGMSFTEFSYQLLQGYDFLHLYKQYQVLIQIGGSDQWGNIIAGTDLIRKVTGEAAFGVTFPLLLKSDGQKFGKSEQGAVWLSPEKLSPYEFYQYLYRTQDADVISSLRMLTFLPIDEIRALERSMIAKDYVPNTAQKKLAQEVTKIVHGDAGLHTALKVTQAAAPGSETVLDANTLEQIAQDMPSVDLPADQISGKKLVDLLVAVKLLPSKAEARRMVKNGGVYLNNQQMNQEDRVIFQEDIVEGRLLLLSIGKKNKMLVKIK
jgi:tyrosyl-tRNA synthetase